MKQNKRSMGIFMLAAFLLVGCNANKSDTNNDIAKGTTAPTATVEAEATTEAMQPTQPPAKEPEETSQAEAAKLSAKETLEQAFQVYSYFVIAPLEVDYSAPMQEIDDIEFYPIKDKKLNTMKKLKAYLSEYFSESIVTELIDMDIYEEIDGLLYTFDGGRGSDISILNEKYKLMDETENKRTYQVEVEYDDDGDEKADDTRNYEFVQEKKAGKWVFTAFPFYR